MPLANELTPLILEKFKEHGQNEALNWFDWLKQRIEWLEGIGGCESAGINIEEVFDIAFFDVLEWRMGQQKCPVGRTSGNTPQQKSENIEAWLSYMEEDLIDVILEQQELSVERTEGIKRFAKSLREDDVIITFNYDTLLEKSLEESQVKWNYGFKEQTTSGVQVLKMHGSINWFLVPRNQADNFGYPLLFKKVDKNREGDNGDPIGELEYDYVLLHCPDDRLANRIENRHLQMSKKQYHIGIAGLGRYKPLDKLLGSAEVWSNAFKSLQQAENVYAIGFSLSLFDTMARLHFAGAMISRYERDKILPKVTVIDPHADRLKPGFQAVFGSRTQINVCKKKGENVDWDGLLDA